MNKRQLSRYALFKGEKLVSLELFKNQGYCNLNYLLQTNQKNYHVRQFNRRDIDRRFEFRVQRLASKKGVAAKPHLLDHASDLMIGEYLSGAHRNRLRPRDIHAVASALKRLHTIRLRGKPLNLKRVIKGNTPKRSKALHILTKYLSRPVLCHNDLNSKNILFSNRVKLIDWEYAAFNDRYFDLASICVEFHLKKREECFLLRRYLNKRASLQLPKLEACKTLYSMLYMQWFKEEEKTAQLSLITPSE